MSIGRFLNHRVSIVRTEAVLGDDDQPTYDDYGQPVFANDTLASDIPAGIQPKSIRELAAISQAGTIDATHTIYMLPRDISTADSIVHASGACPMPVDLPDLTFQIAAVPDAAGAGHHLEIQAKLGSGQQSAYAVPVGSGAGS